MYDCIIVGAGPAGGTAAYHLSKRGRSVLILEKESLPRYKPCQWSLLNSTPVTSVLSRSSAPCFCAC